VEAVQELGGIEAKIVEIESNLVDSPVESSGPVPIT
jgi:hypothetical protein